MVASGFILDVVSDGSSMCAATEAILVKRKRS